MLSMRGSSSFSFCLFWSTIGVVETEGILGGHIYGKNYEKEWKKGRSKEDL